MSRSKNFFLCALLSVALSAHADNEPVPPGTRLNELPLGSKVLALKQLDMPEPDAGGGGWYKRALLKNTFAYARTAPYVLEAGQAIPIKIVEPAPSGKGVSIRFPPFYLRIEEADLRDASVTVGEFNNAFNGLFSIVWNDPQADPFPGLSADVKQDLLMAKILASIKADRHLDALADFARLERLGRKQPESFYFYYVVTLDKAGLPIPAKERAAVFLKTYGRASKYYNEVIAILAK